jgi:membrane protein DedA with SNARE-associated domain
MFVVGLVPLMPTEPVLVGMGVLAASSTSHLSLVAVIAVSAVACSMSDHLLYGFGRVAGVRALDWLAGKRPAVTAASDWLGERVVTRWGLPILIAGRWLPAGGTIGAVLTGTLRWRLVRFTPASVLGSTLWSTYVALLGYLGGALTGQPVAGFLVSVGIATVLGLGCSFFIRRAHHNRPTTANQEPLVAG